jgi:hypothetical protein
MLLITLLKILFSVLVTRHTIKWVSYHIHHRNKKARIFHGNCRMPKEVMFALMYGINAKAKNRFKIKDLSYRKTLAEWKRLLNSIYPSDSKINIPSYMHTNLKSPSGDLGVTIGNRKRKLFPQFKTGNNNFPRTCRGSQSGILPKTSDIRDKILNLKNLKNSRFTTPFTK